ncbi:hypothetical protein VTI28DRAFT_9232 [Corynascus sepedonium]
MLIRTQTSRILARSRPSLTIARTLHNGRNIVPPRTRAYTRFQQPAESIPTRISIRNMSNSTTNTTGFSSAAVTGSSGGASPAPAPSTPPLPGSSPSSAATQGSASAAAAAGHQGGGAAPVPPPTTTTASSASETQPTVGGGPSTSASDTTPKPLPALPSPETATAAGGDDGGVRTVQVNGQAVALDALGPMVVNRDGTVSRIANWPEMSAIERENTLRILCKRNQLRLGNLRAGLPADGPPKEESS